MNRPRCLIYSRTLERLRMTREEYKAFMLFLLDGGMTTREAAQELGITEDNMKMKVATARRYFGRTRKLPVELS